KWPEFSEKMLKKDTITLIIQINGRVRDIIEVKAGISEREAKELTLTRERVKKYLSDKEVKKVIFVAEKLINIVI
ncbi:MAG: Leucine-tRNA ligase, partial [Parcubacteria group bacterium GW2011_GWB1_43_6]